MPLPKSANIGARATEVYSETCTLVLRLISNKTISDEQEDPVLAEVLSFVPFLRQLLTCCACAGIAQDSMTSPGCGHCYCYDCQFRDPLLKIQCRQCRERKGLVVEDQLRIIVKLYKELIMLLSIHFKDSPIIDREPFQEIINEVTHDQKVSRSVLMIPPPPQYRMIPKQVTITPKKSLQKVESDSVGLEPTPSTSSNPTKMKSKIKKKLLMKKALKVKDTPSKSTESGEEQPMSPQVVKVSTELLRQSKCFDKTQRKKPYTIKVSSSIKRKDGHRPLIYPCRCGTNSGVTLSDRICARRKCNCFANEVSCVNCKCRGCCNPYNKK